MAAAIFPTYNLSEAPRRTLPPDTSLVTDVIRCWPRGAPLTLMAAILPCHRSAATVTRMTEPNFSACQVNAGEEATSSPALALLKGRELGLQYLKGCGISGALDGSEDGHLHDRLAGNGEPAIAIPSSRDSVNDEGVNLLFCSDSEDSFSGFSEDE
ncbi:hypothetical protein HPB47_008089 [Ixodes persulcatus]|uniref:Uncharacterized protein n=1 Tax=Ixodes persulcatus TaxID=34615 RepID=A0AC60P5R3_IXOPE|nr:hypothetical protein HPB47_008089 [Ixodes persulcatus]